jgi:hypothetical protein
MRAFANWLIRVIVILVEWVTPLPQRDWALAMRTEVEHLFAPTQNANTGKILRYALGCLLAAIRVRLAHQFRYINSNGTLPYFTAGLIAVCIGVSFLLISNAAWQMAVVNAAAAAIGILLYLTLRAHALRSARNTSVLVLLAALIVLGTALFGTSVAGATRWVSIGPLTLQTSLVLLPMLVLLFARVENKCTTIAMLLLAAAVCIQPDRAMAAALAAPLAILFLLDRSPAKGIAFMASLIAFVDTLNRPDTIPAVPFVDHILWTAFETNPWLGVSLWIGCLVLLVPPLLARRDQPASIRLAYVMCWLAIIASAALGAYPTPLVGYGGSAIVGYFACLVAMTPAADSERKMPERVENGSHNETLMRALASSPRCAA